MKKNKLAIIKLLSFVLLLSFFAPLGIPQTIAETGTRIGSPFWGSFPFTIAINPTSGQPYVATYNDGVKKFNGTAWESLDEMPYSYDVMDLEFNPFDSQPYIIFDDNYGNQGGSVMKFNGTSWLFAGNQNIAGSRITDKDLAFNPETGEPYVAYVKSSDYSVHLARLTGNTWSEVAALSNVGSFSIKMAFHPVTNEPYIAYTHSNNGGDVKISVSRFNGSSLEPVGILRFSANTDDDDLDLAFNPVTHEPYVIFCDGNYNRTSVMKYGSGAWTVVGATGFSGGFAIDTSIKFREGSAEPYASFKTTVNSVSKGMVMRFRDNTWSEVASLTAWGISLDFDFSGENLFAAYYTASDTISVYKYPIQSVTAKPSAPTKLSVR